MSFSKSFNGTKALVLAAVAAFAAEQRASDEGNGAAKGVIDGHARQIEAGVKAITLMIEQAPDAAAIEAGLWGHANADESGTFGYRVGCHSLQTPAKEDGETGG